MDVMSAFLSRLLDKEICLEQPQGFIVADLSDNVCLPKKALYGLNLASRAWNLHFHGVLTELGFMRTHSVAGVDVYHRQDGGGISDITLFVDDITLLGNFHVRRSIRSDHTYLAASSITLGCCC